MSFILDALKKSETDRQRQSAPALFEVKVAAPRRRFPLWAIGPRGVVRRQHRWCCCGSCCASPRPAAPRRPRRPRPCNRLRRRNAPPGMVTVPATCHVHPGKSRRSDVIASGPDSPERGRGGAEHRRRRSPKSRCSRARSRRCRPTTTRATTPRDHAGAGECHRRRAAPGFAAVTRRGAGAGHAAARPAARSARV